MFASDRRARVRLVTSFSRNLLLGTMMSRFSPVRICVLRAPILVTFPYVSSELNQVADFDRAFGQQDQTADEVVENILAAKTNADRDRTAKKRKHRQRHVRVPESRQAERNQQCVERERLDHRGTGFVNAQLWQSSCQHPADPFCGKESEEQKQNAADDFADRHRRILGVLVNSKFQILPSVAPGIGDPFRKGAASFAFDLDAQSFQRPRCRINRQNAIGQQIILLFERGLFQLQPAFDSGFSPGVASSS